MFVATIPAVLYVDKTGRKPILISGAFLMAACHLIVAVLTGLYHKSWDSHRSAGWAACALVWVFAVGQYEYIPYGLSMADFSLQASDIAGDHAHGCSLPKSGL